MYLLSLELLEKIYSLRISNLLIIVYWTLLIGVMCHLRYSLCTSCFQISYENCYFNNMIIVKGNLFIEREIFLCNFQSCIQEHNFFVYHIHVQLLYIWWIDAFNIHEHLFIYFLSIENVSFIFFLSNLFLYFFFFFFF